MTFTYKLDVHSVILNQISLYQIYRSKVPVKCLVDNDSGRTSMAFSIGVCDVFITSMRTEFYAFFDSVTDKLTVAVLVFTICHSFPLFPFFLQEHLLSACHICAFW